MAGRERKSRRKAAQEADESALVWRRHALAVGALCAIALLAYSDSFGGSFLFDSRTLVQQDPRIRAATSENLHLIWTQDYWGSLVGSGLWRPLTTLSYLFNWAMLGNGADPAGYHWVNFLLHAVNLALVYWLGLLVLSETGPAIALAGIWALHPVLTESVTNIVGRADLLAAFGVLAGLICHVNGARESGRRKTAWLAGLALAAIIGMFSKESAIVLLAAMLLYDVAFRTAPWRNRVPGYASLGVVLAVFFSFRYQVLKTLPPATFSFGDNPLVGADFLTARFTAIKVIGKYLWLLVCPLRLSCDYSYNQIPLVSWRFHHWEDWQAIVALAVCAAAAGIAIYCYRRNRPVFFFVGFFFAALAPTANIAMLIGTIMAERFLYLAAIGFAGCLVAAIYAVWPGRAARVLACVCLAFAARTYARNLDWFDGKSLWTSAVQSAPLSFKTHASLANPALDPHAANLDATIREIDQALAILDPLPDERNVAPVYADAGSYYRQKGDLPKSLALLGRARRIDPRLDRVYLELGRTYLAMSDPDNARDALETGLKVRLNPDLFAELSKAYSALGRASEAMVARLEALIVDPTRTELAAGLGTPAHEDICTAAQDVARRYRAAGQTSAVERTERAATDLGCAAH